MAGPSESAFVYLRSEVKVEPLSWRWYAWGHLISPLTHALNITERQLPLLRSFLANPAVHFAAAKDSALEGGPFVGLEEDTLSFVADLVAWTTEQAAGLITLSNDWRSMEQRLLEEANGFSLDSQYSDLPSSLRGLVELSYDLYNNVCPRPLEEVIASVKPEAYAGQELCLFDENDTARGFFLNTPRAETSRNVFLQVPFVDDRIDALARSRYIPTPLETLVQSLNVPTAKKHRFSEFFSLKPPERRSPEYQGDGVRVRYYGHACVLVQTSDFSVLIDPVVACGRDASGTSLTLDDLPDRIDFVFVTHNHQDHFCPEILLQIRHKVGHVLVARNNPGNIADPSMKLALQRMGFRRITVMDQMDKIDVPGGAIVSWPFYGEHADLSINSKQAMYLEVKGRTFAFIADSSCLDRSLYTHLVQQCGPVDTLFVGMECDGAPLSWLYSPYMSIPVKRKDDASRTLSGSDCEQAWTVIEELGCKSVFVYAMGQEPWLRHLCGLQYTSNSKQIIESDKLIARCRDHSIRAERLYGGSELTSG